jgi:hypothetical protein
VDMREGGAPKSHGVSGEGGGGVCDSASYLARSRRVAYLYLALCCYGGSIELCSTKFSFPLGMTLVCPFYSLKEVQGYMMLACGVTLSMEEPGGLGRALSSGGVVCTMEAWRHYFWYCCYVFWYVCHC